MGQVLHGSATTTHAIRAAIQRSRAPLKALAAQYKLHLFVAIAASTLSIYLRPPQTLSISTAVISVT